MNIFDETLTALSEDTAEHREVERMRTAHEAAIPVRTHVLMARDRDEFAHRVAMVRESLSERLAQAGVPDLEDQVLDQLTADMDEKLAVKEAKAERDQKTAERRERQKRLAASKSMEASNLRQVDVSELKAGDKMFTPGLGEAMTIGSDGAVQPYGRTMYNADGQFHGGRTWTVVSNNEGVLTAKDDQGNTKSSPWPEYNGRKVLKVQADTHGGNPRSTHSGPEGKGIEEEDPEGQQPGAVTEHEPVVPQEYPDLTDEVERDADKFDKRRQKVQSVMQKGAPFAGYDDFDACVSANSDKDDPSAYCGRIKNEVEGSTKEASRLSDSDEYAAQVEVATLHRMAGGPPPWVKEKKSDESEGNGNSDSDDANCSKCSGSGKTPDGEGGMSDCESCGGSGKAKSESKESSRKLSWSIDDMRKIVSERQAQTIDGTLVDGQTANALVQIYDALSDSHKSKLTSLSVAQAGDVAWKLVGKTSKAEVATLEQPEPDQAVLPGLPRVGTKGPHENYVELLAHKTGSRWQVHEVDPDGKAFGRIAVKGREPEWGYFAVDKLLEAHDESGEPLVKRV